MVKVKICGITNYNDAKTSVDYGADLLGFIFYEKSPRYISPAAAKEIVRRLPPLIFRVGVFVNESREVITRIMEDCALDIIQFHGDEMPEDIQGYPFRIIKAIRIMNESSLDKMDEFKAGMYLLDAYSDEKYGGSGSTFPWDVAIKAKEKGIVILSGGLNPENIQDAVEIIKPYGVDASSGVESLPGKKDPHRLKDFITRAKGISAC